MAVIDQRYGPFIQQLESYNGGDIAALLQSATTEIHLLRSLLAEARQVVSEADADRVDAGHMDLLDRMDTVLRR